MYNVRKPSRESKNMSKRTVLIIAVALIALCAIGAGAFVLLSGTLDEPPEQSVDQSQVEDNADNGGYYMGRDDGASNAQEANSSISDGSSGGTSATTDIASPPSQSGAATSTVGQELLDYATDMVSNAFAGSNFSNYVASASDIPSALRTKDNWVYAVANGSSIKALLGAAERLNVRVLETKVMSATPQDSLYQITYTFLAHHAVAMSEGDVLTDRTGTATALVRVNSQGKITQYEESVEW